jgi:hypothetical protein
VVVQSCSPNFRKSCWFRTRVRIPSKPPPKRSLHNTYCCCCFTRSSSCSWSCWLLLVVGLFESIARRIPTLIAGNSTRCDGHHVHRSHTLLVVVDGGGVGPRIRNTLIARFLEGGGSVVDCIELLKHCHCNSYHHSCILYPISLIRSLSLSLSRSRSCSLLHLITSHCCCCCWVVVIRLCSHG